MTRTYIVGFDGSEEATDALVLASALRRTGADQLLAVCVYDAAGSSAGRRSLDAEFHGRNDAHAALSAARGRLDSDVDLSSHLIESGSPADALHAIAHRRQADMIVLGSTHRGRLGSALLGGTGEKIVRLAPCPVAIAPRGYAQRKSPRILKVGVGFDGRPESQRALALAADLARDYGATLEVRAVFDVAAEAVPASTGGVLVPEVLTTGREAAETALGAAVDSLPRELSVRSRLVEDRAPDGLAELAGEVDLVVVGSRGHGPVGRLVLGSISMALARRSPAPVLIVPRGA